MKAKIIYCLLIVVFIIYMKQQFLNGFTMDQQLTMGLLLVAVYLWVAVPIPSGASSILLLACMLLFGLVDSVEEAFSGFLSPALYFILMLSLISYSLVFVGIDKMIARFLVKVSKKGPITLVMTLPIFILLLPILLPSAIARFKMLSPLITKLNHYYGFQSRSLFEKFCMYVIGMLNQKATMIIFTGGGFPILASQLLRDYHVADVGWLDWLLHIGPPLWAGCLLIVIFVWQYLKKTNPEDDWFKEDKLVNFPEEENKEQYTPVFWLVISTFLLMILTWIIADQDKVPLLLPPMILIVLYSFPGVKIITNKVIRNYDWENFLLLGSSFSLGMLMARNGTADALAKELISLVSPDQSFVIKIVTIALFVFLIRLLFVVPSSAMIVIFPIVVSYAEIMHIQAEKLTFMIIMIIGGVMILPIHSPTTFFAYETGVFTKKEQYIIGTFSSFVIMFMSILAAIYYW